MRLLGRQHQLQNLLLLPLQITQEMLQGGSSKSTLPPLPAAAAAGAGCNQGPTQAANQQQQQQQLGHLVQRIGPIMKAASVLNPGEPANIDAAADAATALCHSVFSSPAFAVPVHSFVCFYTMHMHVAPYGYCGSITGLCFHDLPADSAGCRKFRHFTAASASCVLHRSPAAACLCVFG
jgi:hypothetical protein